MRFFVLFLLVSCNKQEEINGVGDFQLHFTAKVAGKVCYNISSPKNISGDYCLTRVDK